MILITLGLVRHSDNSFRMPLGSNNMKVEITKNGVYRSVIIGYLLGKKIPLYDEESTTLDECLKKLDKNLDRVFNKLMNEILP